VLKQTEDAAEVVVDDRDFRVSRERRPFSTSDHQVTVETKTFGESVLILKAILGIREKIDEQLWSVDFKSSELAYKINWERDQGDQPPEFEEVPTFNNRITFRTSDFIGLVPILEAVAALKGEVDEWEVAVTIRSEESADITGTSVGFKLYCEGALGTVVFLLSKFQSREKGGADGGPTILRLEQEAGQS